MGRPKKNPEGNPVARLMEAIGSKRDKNAFLEASFAHLSKRFGKDGMTAFVEIVFETFFESPKGSQNRARILESYIRLLAGGKEKPVDLSDLDLMSDEEMEDMTQRLMRRTDGAQEVSAGDPA